MTAADKSKPPSKSKGMKSAYELALERLEAQGIEPPREEAMSAERKGAIAEARRTTEARLAELEILHRDKMNKLADPAARQEQEEFFLNERRRLESDLERKLEKLRDQNGSSSSSMPK